ncbi:MAG: heavy metal-binding domain-containing protein, partial [Pseudomonadota bacterium]|nr:heavy metal-binding domain-containing protein [Pseudomonadota bacterium]
MKVDPDNSKYKTEYKDESYYFCSAGCEKKFAEDPEKYLKPREEETAIPGAIYTCPMHPEVRQEGPGNCPICGMALEPETITGEEGENPELTDFRRRFWIGLILTLPVFLMEMGAHVFGLHLTGPHMSNWIQLAFGTPVVLWAGWPFFERAWMSFKTRNLNMFTLIAIGTGVAWLYSIVATLAPGLFPDAFKGPE